MDLILLTALVEQIKGCTFGSLDTLCEAAPGVMHRKIGENVIIFRTNGASGYESIVKRHLTEAGKDPDSWHVGPLPWGERIGNLPLISHNGKVYLQTITLSHGKEDFFLAFSSIPVNPKDFGIRSSRPQPNLPVDSQVRMHTYNIENIEKITLFGETLTDTVTVEKTRRAILGIKA